MKLSLSMVGWTAEEEMRAHLDSEALAAGAKTQEGYEDRWHHEEYIEVVRELSAIRMWKVQSYGVERYTITDIDTNAWLCYTDCRRKSVRLEQLTRSAARGDVGDLERLIETYADLANYAILAVQVLGRSANDKDSILARRQGGHEQASSRHEQTSEPTK